MATTGPSISVREVFRFGTSVIVRLLVACLFGLLTMKVGQYLSDWSSKDAVLYGKIAVGVFMFVSLYVRGIAWPEVDLGPDPEEAKAVD